MEKAEECSWNGKEREAWVITAGEQQPCTDDEEPKLKSTVQSASNDAINSHGERGLFGVQRRARGNRKPHSLYLLD